MTFGLFKKCYASDVVHAHLLSHCFDVQIQVIRLRIKVVQLIWYRDMSSKERQEQNYKFFLFQIKFVKMKKFLQFWPSNNQTHKKVF